MKNRLKKDKSIKIDTIIIWGLSLIILDRSLTGKNPPDEIIVKARFKESKVLIENKFNNINITNVKPEYNIKILVACLTLSELLKEVKLVKVFLKLSS